MVDQGWKVILLMRVVSVLFLLASPIFAQVTVVIEEAGSFKFLSGESLEFNSRDRVRLCPASEDYYARQVSSCQSRRLNSLPTIHRDFIRGELVVSPAEASLTVLPDGLKTDGDSVELWSQAPGALTSGRRQSEPLPDGRILAILHASEPEESLRVYLSDESHFAQPAGQAEALALQGRLIAAAIRAFPESESIRRLRDDPLAKLEAAVNEYGEGLVGEPELEQTRRRVQASAALFPSDPKFQTQRDRFAALEENLAKRRSILRALATGSQWDAYLRQYSQMQRYEFLFPELGEVQRNALAMSRDQHKLAAQARLDIKDCGSALLHLRLALKRDPGDLAARELSESARVCLVRAPRASRKGSNLGSLSDTAPALRITEFVNRFIAEGKADSAERSLLQGLGQYPDFPPLLLSQVRLLERQGKYREALGILDRYDALVSVEADWDKGDRARRDMEFQILKGRDERGSKLDAFLKENRFESALVLVKEGLLSDPEDHELLFRAGILSLLKRQLSEARAYLLRYIDAAQSLSGSPGRRKQAFAILSRIDAPQPARTDGKRHWFSHAPIDPSVAYDPVSLQFSARIDEITTNNKQVTKFHWNGEQLESIQTSTDQKPPRVLSRFKFEYGADSLAVSRIFDANVANASGQPVSNLEQQRPRTIFDDPVEAPTSPDDAEKAARPLDLVSTLAGPGLPVLLANHPMLDIPLAEELLGSRLGHVIAGNKYFHPFSWDQPRLFRTSHDASGRIRQAFPVGPDVKVPEVYEFAWDGNLLQSISIFTALPSGAPDGSKLIYRRSMRYADGKLVSETTTPPAGKPSMIDYKYQGQQLISAEVSEDATLNNQSRKVSFR